MSYDFDALEKWLHEQLAAQGVPYLPQKTAHALFDQTTIDYAATKGIAAEELPLMVNGCSGGLSWLYSIGGRRISCEKCCNCHDIDYQLGGTPADRKQADQRLRECAGAAGGWKRARAWGMWLAVRLFGWLYWPKG